MGLKPAMMPSPTTKAPIQRTSESLYTYRPEDAKLVSRSYQRTVNLWMPVDFLGIGVIVDEQELRWNVLDASRILALLVVQLHCQVPQCDGVIPRCNRDDAGVGRVPLDAGDLLLEVVEAGHRTRLCRPATARAWFPLPQVPDRPDAVVRSRCQQMCRLPRPAHHVHVGIADVHRDGRLAAFTPHIPYADRAVARCRRKDGCFGRAPLDFLHAARVPDEGSGVGDEAAAVASGCYVDYAVVISREQLPGWMQR